MSEVARTVGVPEASHRDPRGRRAHGSEVGVMTSDASAQCAFLSGKQPDSPMCAKVPKWSVRTPGGGSMPPRNMTVCDEHYEFLRGWYRDKLTVEPLASAERMDLDAIARLTPYVVALNDKRADAFEVYLAEQKIPEHQHKEARFWWNEIVEHKKQYPGGTIMIPSD